MTPPSKATDVRITSIALYFLPVETRVPLKFGPEVTRSVTCARVRVTVRGRGGEQADGWGETPLSVQWVWPSTLPYEPRHRALKEFCQKLSYALVEFDRHGHPLEITHDFLEGELPELADRFNNDRDGDAMPYLAALVCLSAFDVALHDAYGNLHQRDVYATYNSQFLTRDLSYYLTSEPKGDVDFKGRFPEDFLVRSAPQRLKAWHLVGGLDPLAADDLTGEEPDDGYPVLLEDWITTDGLQCLKVKLRGNDRDWDYDRLRTVGRIAIKNNVPWLSSDFNCTVTDPEYVNSILDNLRDDEPQIYGMLLYVEQPFPYDLEQFAIDVHSVAARKPLFLDESAHDWKFVRLGRELGWSGVALKTCKTQTGALLSLCWANAHGMPLMVQDLTNPMLAQIPHVRLAAHCGTIMGVETNAMQFYPEASSIEAQVHPGLYRRRQGCVDLSTLGGSGFGYQADRIPRELPPPV